MTHQFDLFLNNTQPDRFLIEVLPGHRVYPAGMRFYASHCYALGCYHIFDIDGHPLGLLHQMYVKEVEK